MLIFLLPTLIQQITLSQTSWPIDPSVATAMVTNNPSTLIVGYGFSSPSNYTQWTTRLQFDTANLQIVEANLTFYVTFAQFNELSYTVFNRSLGSYIVGQNNTVPLEVLDSLETLDITISGSNVPTQTNQLVMLQFILSVRTLERTTIITSRTTNTTTATSIEPTTTSPTTEISGTVAITQNTTFNTLTVIGNGTVIATGVTITIADNSVLDLSQLASDIETVTVFEAGSIVGNFQTIIPPNSPDNCTTIRIRPMYTTTTLQVFVDRDSLQCSLGLIVGLSALGIVLGISLAVAVYMYQKFKKERFMKQAKQQIQDNTLEDLQRQLRETK